MGNCASSQKALVLAKQGEGVKIFFLQGQRVFGSILFVTLLKTGR